MADTLRRWQNLAIERAVTVELAELEVEEAKVRGNSESIAIADRYYDQAKRMLRSAMRKLEELTGETGLAA